MSIRHTMRIRGAALAVVAGTTALALTVSGCSGGDGGDDKPGKGSPAGEPPASGEENGKGESGPAPDGQPLAQVRGGDNMTLVITSATREEGGFVTVSGELKNGSGTLWLKPSWSGDEEELRAKNAVSMAGASLIDKSGRKRYYILRDTEGHCLCTVFQGGIQAGKQATWYAQFPAPPEGNNEVDFQIADMPPAGITISEE